MFYVGLSARAGFEVAPETARRFYGDNMSLAARYCIVLSGKGSEFVSETGHVRRGHWAPRRRMFYETKDDGSMMRQMMVR